jgi:hypothetical protein
LNERQEYYSSYLARGKKRSEPKQVIKQLTVKVKHAAVLATDRPFLVNCNGPSFIIKYE